MWAITLPILVSVLNLGPLYATDRRQTSDRRQADRRQTEASLNAPLIRGGGKTSVR